MAMYQVINHKSSGHLCTDSAKLRISKDIVDYYCFDERAFHQTMSQLT